MKEYNSINLDRKAHTINPHAKLAQHASYLDLIKTIILLPLILAFNIGLKIKL